MINNLAVPVLPSIPVHMSLENAYMESVWAGRMNTPMHRTETQSRTTKKRYAR
jgi:hypothetical protein